MTVKEYLSQAKLLDLEINERLSERSHLHDLATRVTGTISDMPKPAGGRITGRESVLAKLIDVERDIDAAIDRLIDLKREMTVLIERLPDRRERVVLKCRYLHNVTWASIASTLGISEAQLYRIHNDGLEKLEKIFQMRVNAIP